MDAEHCIVAFREPRGREQTNDMILVRDRAGCVRTFSSTNVAKRAAGPLGVVSELELAHVRELNEHKTRHWSWVPKGTGNENKQG